LHEVNAPEEIIDDIRGHSYREPTSRLYFRFWHVLADILVYAPIDFVEHIIEIIKEALSTDSLHHTLSILVNRLIELVETESLKRDSMSDN
jgi:hypothetical protein